MDAERSKLNDPGNKYKGYDLSQAAFKFSLDFSRWYEANYPYEIKITTEDGQMLSIKKGYLRVNKQASGTDSEEIKEWKSGTTYKAGDIVTYNNYKYKCLQAHRAIVSWEPTVALSLWARVY
ncbi:carbohydrate-binding protein [Clostridium sporogenes]|nr:carbohydrate-binding protein [Clostridium sporogenes]KRU31626.1 carbohydrate-binding protein [Clostridium sporogenes]KRU33114.1 carbohydrate-binding protein [Clostridium sporogenes]KRU38827.1 carbohydrate-binding protein [Clostridium sporogenes]OQP94805.1 carbohydrate-binding protein [Clostridium sporogenes]